MLRGHPPPKLVCFSGRLAVRAYASNERTLKVTIEGSLGLRRGDGACVFAIATLDGRDVGSTAVGLGFFVATCGGWYAAWVST